MLHLLAQGGWIELERDDDGRIETAHCHTRDNWRFSDFDLDLFRRLKRRRAIASRASGPYRITRRGLELVRARQDNR
ncbi:YjhX family toxin [Mesorhizobium sp. CAU 1741]|uniref:YjhX family toxin n=1 Tax=Mesorhizobium sp. CAU 1741 TaxID=3140366 RepID=UPI00325BE208